MFRRRGTQRVCITWRATPLGRARHRFVGEWFVSTGRGEQDIQWYDGDDWAIAWQGNTFNFDIVPAFVRFPSIPSLAGRITALETGRPIGAAPIPIPPGGAIDALWTGVYTAADFDTPAEIAIRVQKQLDAIQELVALLKVAGVLI